MERISSRLAELDYNRSVTRITNKIKQLKTKYKQVLDNNRRSGRAEIDWKYFDEVDTILGTNTGFQQRKLLIIVGDDWNSYQKTTKKQWKKS